MDIRKADVTVSVYDANRKQIFTQTIENVLPLGNQFLTEVKVKNPVLWDVDSPNLYTLRIDYKCRRTDIDSGRTLRFRQFEFQEKGPFFLNGRRLLLQGTHRHEDHAGVAQAMTEDMMRTEMQLMKDMGVNFIRLGHYQQSDIILQLCDSLGILCLGRNPWCRGGLGDLVYKEQTAVCWLI